MNSLADMIWIEYIKAIRSRLPLWTALASLFMPAGIAFLIFIAKNPEISRQLGLVSAKANLMAYAATDWKTYLSLYGQIIAAGGFFLYLLAISWIFGREFVDGTVKDLLAVPVPRATILLAKFIVFTIWSAGLSVVIFCAGLVTGAAIHLPGSSNEIILQGAALVAVTAVLVIPVVMPFAFFASAGRGYLLPIGLAIMALMLANLLAVVGWAEYYPWGVPALYAQGKTTLAPISYWLVVLTGLAGMGATYLWWVNADQSR
jgi:ABC-2 type transport system permease protein